MSSDSPTRIDMTPSSWYDLWHVHPDMAETGNASAKARRASLRKLIRTHDSIARQVKLWSKPHQTWMLVDPSDSGQDAAYLHTPNPNKDNFPYTFEGVLWGGSRVPRWIRQEFDPSRFKLGRSKFRGWVMFWAVERQPGAVS
jgi:hypothetical protein